MYLCAPAKYKIEIQQSVQMDAYCYCNRPILNEYARYARYSGLVRSVW